MNIEFSGPVTVFHGRTLPEAAQPVGYGALIDAYELKIPLPYRLCVIGSTYRIWEDKEWRYFSPRYKPVPSLAGHLTFAMKYEGLDLAALSSLFQLLHQSEMEALVLEKPTGSYSRRLWYLYEWLTGNRLDIPDLNSGNYVPVVDPDMQIAVPGKRISRQRIVDNLPGTPRFCPMVFKTSVLKEFMAKDLKSEAIKVISRIPADIVSRTAAFLLLKDSKASYTIENETPPHKRIERWGQIIGQAGSRKLDLEELIRLQKIVLGDTRFVKPGLRSEGGFVGEHDRDTGMPLPDHISARPADLPALVQGMIDFASICEANMDPVILSAVMAFGFIYIHPFSDGNGRLHRYLIHHILAENGFNPPGLVFPVSSVILDRIVEYRKVLQGYSSRLLPFIDWEPTAHNNVHVINETDTFYRFFDATPHGEFLYSCVERTISIDLLEEAQFLQRYDRFKEEVAEIVEMPSVTIDLLFRFLKQNGGKLSRRARDREFKELTDEEAVSLEEIYFRLMS